MTRCKNNKTPLFYYLGSAPALSLLLEAATAGQLDTRAHRDTHHWTWTLHAGSHGEDLAHFGIICVMFLLSRDILDLL